MYKLTLTESEMSAFTWVGYRYDSSGDKMSDLICEGMPENREWGVGEITFDIPENVAWEMQEIAQNEGYNFPCFSDNLRQKMKRFLFKIV